MTQSRHQAIRNLLLGARDGLTVDDIADHFACNPNTLYNTMPAVWGVYIDRWIGPNRGQYRAVYVCIEVPPNTPRPKGKKND